MSFIGDKAWKLVSVRSTTGMRRHRAVFCHHKHIEEEVIFLFFKGINKYMYCVRNTTFIFENGIAISVGSETTC